MDRWRQLFVEVTAQEAGRLEADRRSRAALRAAQELEAWSRSAAPAVMDSLEVACRARADELARMTGVAVSVTRSAPTSVDSKDGCARVLGLSLRDRVHEVVIYGYLHSGNLPVIHFLMNAKGGGVQVGRHRRLVSFPGCRVTPGDDGRPVLRPVGRSTPTSGSEQLTTDDLVFRAFELLLRRALGRPAAAAERVLRSGASTPLLGSLR